MDESIKNNLLSIPGHDTIKQAIFNIGASRAPSPDGFPIAFFHHDWLAIVANVIKHVQQVFEGTRNVDEINKTLINLIPKFENLEFVN